MMQSGYNSALFRTRRSLVSAVILLAAAALIADARHCDDEVAGQFDDVASLTVLSRAVLDGRLVQNAGDADIVEFHVRQLHKGSELVSEVAAESARVRVAVRVSSVDCAGWLRRRRRRYLVFLNGSVEDRVTDDQQRQVIYWSTAAPVRYSQRSVRIVKQHSCSDCAAAPSSAQIRPRAVYGTFGHPMELNCRASRGTEPTPRIDWFKDGVPVVPSDRIQIEKERRGATLLIREARLDDAGAYSCHVANVIGSAVSASNHVTVARPAPASNPHSELCEVQYYCLNQGTCYVIVPVNLTYCECRHPYTGPRCRDVHLDHTMDTASIVSSPVAFGSLLLAASVILLLLVVIAYFVINEFKKRQTQTRPSVIAANVNGCMTKGSGSSRQYSRATQTGQSLERPLPYVVVTAPTGGHGRPEPTLMRQVWPPAPVANPSTASDGSSAHPRSRLSAISISPDSTSSSPESDRAGETVVKFALPDRDVEENRPIVVEQRSPANGAVHNAGSGDDDVERRLEEEAEVEALLRDLGVDASSLDTI